MSKNKVALISGITGQDGAYLSELLLEKGYTVYGLTRSNDRSKLYRLAYLGLKEKINFLQCDLLDLSQCIKILESCQPVEIYNLAAQSSVSQSFKQPIGTINFNVFSVLNLLEAIKIVNPKIKFYQASSSEMYGKVKNLPVTENSVINPQSPYAISKATGHWSAMNYKESYGLFACCGVLFNHESYLRTSDFFVKKVIQSTIKISHGLQDNLKVGNIEIKRDFGYAPDYVKAIWLMMQRSEPENYLICSGESVLLSDIIYYVFDKLNVSHNKLIRDKSLFRPTDIEDIYGDNTKAKNELGWDYNKNFWEVLDLILNEEVINFEKTASFENVTE